MIYIAVFGLTFCTLNAFNSYRDKNRDALLGWVAAALFAASILADKLSAAT